MQTREADQQGVKGVERIVVNWRFIAQLWEVDRLGMWDKSYQIICAF